MARFNRTITVTAGTNVRLSDGATAATAGEILAPIFVGKLSIQMAAGGAGLGYVMLGIPNGVTPNPNTSGHLTAQLGAAPSATQPGGSLADPQYGFGVFDGTEDITKAWVGGSNTGDKIIVSWDTKD